jgi:hypothetical protein
VAAHGRLMAAGGVIDTGRHGVTENEMEICDRQSLAEAVHGHSNTVTQRKGASVHHGPSPTRQHANESEGGRSDVARAVPGATVIAMSVHTWSEYGILLPIRPCPAEFMSTHGPAYYTYRTEGLEK